MTRPDEAGWIGISRFYLVEGGLGFYARDRRAGSRASAQGQGMDRPKKYT
jgi:hypothetical protein